MRYTIKFSYRIKAETGLHGRAAAHLVNKCQEFKSNISVIHHGKIGNADSLMSLESLEVRQGDVINVIIDGEDECLAY